MDIAISFNKIPIRLTAERWQHITTGHPEIAAYYYEILDTIENPEIVYEGNYNAFIACKDILLTENKFIVVIFKESSNKDGFVITAYISNKKQEFQKKKILWEKQK